MTIESPRVSQFFPDVLNMTVTQFISKFELWSGTRGNKSKFHPFIHLNEAYPHTVIGWEERATVYDINKESADYIVKGLRKYCLIHLFARSTHFLLNRYCYG